MNPKLPSGWRDKTTPKKKKRTKIKKVTTEEKASIVFTLQVRMEGDVWGHGRRLPAIRDFTENVGSTKRFRVARIVHNHLLGRCGLFTQFTKFLHIQIQSIIALYQ